MPCLLDPDPIGCHNRAGSRGNVMGELPDGFAIRLPLTSAPRPPAAGKGIRRAIHPAPGFRPGRCSARGHLAQAGGDALPERAAPARRLGDDASRPLSYSEPGYATLFVGAWPGLSDGPAEIWSLRIFPPLPRMTIFRCPPYRAEDGNFRLLLVREAGAAGCRVCRFIPRGEGGLRTPQVVALRRCPGWIRTLTGSS